MLKTDCIQRFYFQDLAIRGAIVKLSNSFIEALNGHNYPDTINTLLGECLVACSLMSSNIKVASRLTLQARGNGPINLLMAESVLNLPNRLQEHLPDIENTEPKNKKIPHQTIRAYARCDKIKIADLSSQTSQQTPLSTLLGKAQLTLSIETHENKRYQSIVELAGDSLERCLERYFLQSEQLPTFLKFAVSDTVSAGLLLQKMPMDEHNSLSASTATKENAIWQELTILASSISKNELCQLPTETVLHRLFHQHLYQTTVPQAIVFSCSCSLTRTASALLQIGEAELQRMLDNDGEIVIDCEFCSAKYRYNQQAIDKLLA